MMYERDVQTTLNAHYGEPFFIFHLLCISCFFFDIPPSIEAILRIGKDHRNGEGDGEGEWVAGVFFIFIFSF